MNCEWVSVTLLAIKFDSLFWLPGDKGGNGLQGVLDQPILMSK